MKRFAPALMKEEGSFTVEAALVFTVLVLAFAFLTAALLILYQQVLLNRTAAAAAEAAAALWPEGEGLYEGLFPVLDEASLEAPAEENADPAEKTGRLFIEQSIQSVVYQRLAGGVIKPVKTTAVLNIKNGLLTRNVLVVITQEINVPGGKILSFFGGRKTLPLSGKGTASIIKPAQYIRNVDLTLEYAERINEMSGGLNKLSELKERIGKWAKSRRGG
ncbi:MAG: hypothetical protein QHH10_07240 [Peptococcaceae bacterium]|jgi:hypothetical protein|nr:hypothetical protein [Peptococcaceae bacterium]MDH7525095.1 hypothetical protein [Peptococcaceae bacterium]